jgi:hypothetical protein
MEKVHRPGECEEKMMAVGQKERNDTREVSGTVEHWRKMKTFP